MKNIKLISFFVILVLITGVLFVSCKKKTTTLDATQTNQEEQSKDNTKIDTTSPSGANPSTEATSHSNFIPTYKIVKESNQLRTDGGMTYFILIDPVYLSTVDPIVLFTNDFVVQIKNIIKDVVINVKKQENVSIEIFDNIVALETTYKENNLNDPLLKTNYIAQFIGKSNDFIYRNTLYIYPNPTSDKKKAGEYYDVIDFSPYNW